MERLPKLKEMEEAFLQKDHTYDGIFFTAVRTTGIFCRPSCTARKPLLNNISFFATAREALFAGYRPCLRCHPMEQTDQRPEWLQQIFDRVERNPAERLSDFSIRKMGIDPERVRRYFVKNYGMTFQAYCRARRLGGALNMIREGARLDDVTFESGYESLSGFRDAFGKLFGKPPGIAREEECISIDWMDSPVGPLLLGTITDGICLLEFTDRRMLEGQLQTLQKRFGRTMIPGVNHHTDKARKQLNEYFAGNRSDFELPLVYPGTPFETRVWNALLTIPFGQTRTYEDIAREIGSPAAVRAVGRANGMNRIAILIPCHRVVNKSGKLGGYGGGLWRKQFLLNLECKQALQ